MQSMHKLNKILLLISLSAFCSLAHSKQEQLSTLLIDGEQGLDNFVVIGDGNWQATEGAIQVSKSEGNSTFLMTKKSYDNFSLEIEFWASDDANSGIFMRCQDVDNITDRNCYEANIYDQRPEQNYATGAIVNVAEAPVPAMKVGSKWNTYQITLNSNHLVVTLNGVKTVDVHDSKLRNGPIGLQCGKGTLKFRKFKMTEIK